MTQAAARADENVGPATGRAPPRVVIPPGRPEAERHGPAEGHTGRESADGLRAVRGVDWDRPRVIDLFAGIGGIRLGFEAHGARCVFSSEWDEEAATTYEANFGERPAGDITKVDPASIPDHDVLLAGFPCQPFSIIGSRAGFGDTRGTLFFTIEEVLRAKRPAALLLENVKQFRTHDGGRTYRTVVDALSRLGYRTWTGVLNALHYGVAQRRERTFIVGFRSEVGFAFPERAREAARLEDVLEDEGAVDRGLFASERIVRKRRERLREQGVEPFYPSVWHENKGGFVGVHPYSCALRASASYNYLLVNGVRRPSSRENLRLQGFPEGYRVVVSDAALRKQAGNSVAVSVVRAVAGAMVAAGKGA